MEKKAELALLSIKPLYSYIVEKVPVVVLPVSLAIAVEQDYKSGGFRCFGDKVKEQQKAKEAVLLLIATLYTRALKSGEGLSKYIPLPAKAMEKKFGVRKSSSASKVCWATIKRFCLSPKRAYIQEDGFYKPGAKATCYRLNLEKITDKRECYYQFQEKLIINKIIRDKARGASVEASAGAELEWKVNSKRKLGETITRDNLLRLGFDVDALEVICNEMFDIALGELLGWVEQIKRNPGVHFTTDFTVVNNSVKLSFTRLNVEVVNTCDKAEHSIQDQSQYSYCGKVVRRTWGTLYTHHRVHTFLPNNLKEIRVLWCQKRRTTDTMQSRINRDDNLERQKARRQQVVRSIMILLLGATEKDVFTDNKGGRLYHSITSLKTEVRKTLRFRNEYEQLERIVSFDVKTCQPWLLGLVILKDYSNRGAVPPREVYEYLELIETRDLYNSIVDFSGQDISRAAVKKYVMHDVYRSKYVDKRCRIVSDQPLTVAGEFLVQKFPSVWRWIIDNKGDKAKSVIPVTMQRLEADFFIDIVIPELTERGIWCLTIHDSVLVREKDAEFVESFLEESMISFFGRAAVVAKEVYGSVIDLMAA